MHSNMRILIEPQSFPILPWEVILPIELFFVYFAFIWKAQVE